MKKLQNNFTTPEQSKRLLELGVPADSADCVLENLDTVENGFSENGYTRWIIEDRHVKSDIFSDRHKDIFLPCWSVGRLFEIYLICQIFGEGLYFSSADDWDENMLDELCNLFSTIVKCNYFDFSKLEE